MLSREIPLDPARSALLFVDVQRFVTDRDGGDYAGLTEAEFAARYGWFFGEIHARTLPAMARLQAACRGAGIEVMYTVIESLTRDGRDRSLDYRITGFNVPKGSPDAEVDPAIAPGPDEIVIPKTASSVFNATNIDYVLRNLGVGQLVIAGFLTDQCVESAVRDACDKGYLVTLVTDACATLTPERHAASLRALAGYCRQRSVDQIAAELSAARA